MAEQKTGGADVVSTNVAEVFGSIRRGAFLADCAMRLEELVGAVREHAKGGKLTIELELKPFNSGSGDVVTLTDKITVKLPKPGTQATVFFTSRRNTLQREDPRQMELGAGE